MDAGLCFQKDVIAGHMSRMRIENHLATFPKLIGACTRTIAAVKQETAPRGAALAPVQLRQMDKQALVW
eukprot:scaffold207776_cov32-Tisochrysis_lutea.AAC.1